MIEIYAFYSDRLPKLYLYKTVFREGNWEHGEVVKPHHLLTLVKDGAFTVITEGKRYDLKKDDIFFIPKGTPYSLESKVPFLHTVFHFDADIRDTGEAESEKTTDSECFLFPRKVQSSVAVKLDIERASREFEGDGVLEFERRLALLGVLLGIAKLSVRDKRNELAEKIKSYITAHAQEGINLDDLCRHFSYTRQYLIRIFKRETGKTPIAAMNEIKLSKSVHELLNSDKNISEVAEACGFDDYNYFSRLFKKRFGTSPSKYREKYFII